MLYLSTVFFLSFLSNLHIELCFGNMFKLGMLKLLENVIVSHKIKLDLFTPALQGKVPPGFFHQPRSIFTRIFIPPPVGKKGEIWSFHKDNKRLHCWFRTYRFCCYKSEELPNSFWNFAYVFGFVVKIY